MNHAHFRPAWDRTTHLPTSYDMSKIVLLAMLGSAVLPAMASGDVSVVQPAADRTLKSTRQGTPLAVARTSGSGPLGVPPCCQHGSVDRGRIAAMFTKGKP